MRYVVLPQAIRRVVPPLLNDFISLQKDTALVATVGPLEALRPAQIHAATTSTTRPTWWRRCCSSLLTIPLARFTDHLAARSAPPVSGGADDGLLTHRRGVRKTSGGHSVLRGIDLEVAPHEVVCLIGASGSGKSTLLRCVNLLETIDDGAIHLDGRGDHRPAGRRRRRAQAVGHRVPGATTCSRT